MFRQVAVTLEMIKIQHTIFALPFAFLAAVAAARGVPPLRTIVWIVVAMVGARSSAMAFNRLVDAKIDAENPRTRSRALPSGLVSRSFVTIFTILSIATFVLASAMLNRLALLLSPVALLVILGYSYTKRFTALAHVALGLALAIAPAGAWVAVRGRVDSEVLPLAAAVLFWTAGFDVLYAMQDLEFDSRRGLHSIPSRLGGSRALIVARIFHIISFGSFIAFGLANGLGWLYFGALIPAAALLIWQHSIVKVDDLSRIDAAFFNANGALAIVLFACGACDILLMA